MKRIQTRVGSDLTKYTENFFFGMSLRQTLLSAAGVAATAAVYIFLPVPGIAAAACGLPMFALAFLKPDGLSAEKWLYYWLRANILRPRVRVHLERSALYDFLWHGKLLGRTVLKRRVLLRIAREEHGEHKKGGFFYDTTQKKTHASGAGHSADK